jgi:phosphoribosyl 1,2-cyclic phosphodiesterase
MKVVILGSGSKGNCTYIETKTKKILIDAGLSLLQVKNRLAQKGITFDRIDLVLVTHEHVDHIKFLSSIINKTKATLCIKEETYYDANRRLSGALTHEKVRFINPDKKYTIDELSFIPIMLSHDATNCFGYILKEETDNLDDNITYASITDTGFVPNKYYKILSTVSVILLESNHDVLMQKRSGRPWILINRVLSERGHLSNEQCCDVLKNITSKYTKRVIFGHISEECNTPELVVDTCKSSFNNQIPFIIDVAKQHEALDIIEVE